ncbi:MAG: triacylglycerol lipase, partial [Myxococcales bacterium]|nr:triacylglycerol lipase [Myxococcales bacterium]
DPNDPIWSYIREVGADQGAIIQLTPEGMNLFNAAVIDRPGVRYASVVVAAPRPSLSELARYRSLKHTVLYGVFALLHAIAAREHLHYPYPWPIEQHLRQLVASLPFEPTSETNDGIVPTLSQIHGEILDTQLADHLDVVGQFYNAGGRPLSDWLPSGSHFDEAKFVAVWSRIADFICRESALFSQLPA